MKKTTLFALALLNWLSVVAQGGFFTTEGNTYSEEVRAKNFSANETKRKEIPTSDIRTDFKCYLHYTNSQGMRDSSVLITDKNFNVPIDTTQDISFSVYNEDGIKLQITQYRFRNPCNMGNVAMFEDGNVLNKYKLKPFEMNCNRWIVELKVIDGDRAFKQLIIQNGNWRSL